MKIEKKLSSLLLLLALPFLTILPFSKLSAQTIAEKKASLHRGSTTGGTELDPQTQALLSKVNLDLSLKKSELHKLYSQVIQLHNQNAGPESFQNLLAKINTIRDEIKVLDDQWLEAATQANEGGGYALWHQPETTLEQLVIDYGSQDYVYLMSPEISAIKLSINSNLPIPRASWNEMLELILKQNGVGIRQLNPYLRELYLFKQNNHPLNYITNQRQDLELFPRDERIAFWLSPDPADVRRIWFFLDKFVNPTITLVQQVGRDILIIGQVGDIQDLLRLYDFIVSHHSDKEFKLVPLFKIKAEDMAKILGAVFDQLVSISEKDNPPSSAPSSGKPPSEAEFENTNGLKVIILSSLSQALFLVGTKEEITKAETMIRDLERQIGGAREKIVYWYTTKHTKPEDLADILDRIYRVMVQQRIGAERRREQQQQIDTAQVFRDAAEEAVQAAAANLPQHLYEDNFYQEGAVAVNPAPIPLIPPTIPENPNRNRENFIVDPKTGAIVMVVEQDILPRLQEIIKKLDIPKKMVQIEVLMFEKKINDTTAYGLNLLRIGGKASNTNLNSVTFNNVRPVGSTVPDPFMAGILEFAFSRMRTSNTPAYDLVYQFLITQNDVTINANPSVLTINQTTAKVAIVEEFSINTGVVEIDTTGGTTLKDSFTRGQYGITLDITPTIHMREEDDDWDEDLPDYITLDTNVNFDTIQNDPLQPNRPTVTRRNIHNEVLIPDGQTVILGGLRNKTTQDSKEAIPFLGEIPGFGKLFSNTVMVDTSTEMIIFITPKIVSDPCEDLERIRNEQLQRRPGDLPDFMIQLSEARKFEQCCMYEGTVKILFGRPSDGYYHTSSACDKDKGFLDCGEFYEGEYNGR